MPVISIGNITAGGTGKTPLVIWLVQNIPSSSSKAILLSRGYGGDEQKLFSDVLPETPHFMNSKRFIAGKEAIRKHGENIYFILDDGFQHRQLHRDLNIVLIDATCPFGYEYILPRGFLRESLKGLKRADIFFLTRCNMVSKEEILKIEEKLDKIAGKKLHVLSNHVPYKLRHNVTNETEEITYFIHKKAYIFSGIGNPKGFLHTIENIPIHVVGEHSFEDHYHYKEDDLAFICKKASEVDADVIITTAKDAVKLPKKELQIPIWILEITISIEEGKQQLLEHIKRVMHTA